MKRHQEYRDTGIEWVGAAPSHWSVQKLKTLVARKTETGKPEETVLSLYRDYGVIPKDSRSDNYNRTSDNTDSYRVVAKDDLVVNKMKAWQGSLAVSTHDGIISPAYFVYRITDSQIYPRFLHYALRNPSYIPEYKRLSGGIRPGQWDLSPEAFSQVLFLIPPYSEQVTISEFLDEKTAEIDSLIEKTEKSIVLLEEYRKSVISEAVTKGLDVDASMKDSGIDWIGEIPSHWSSDSLSRSMDVITNGFVGPTRNLFQETGIRYIQSLHVADGSLDFEKRPYYVSEEWSTKHNRSILKEGDVLVVQTGAIGNVAYVDSEFEGCNCHALIILRSSNRVLGKYLYYCLSSVRGKDALLMTKTGATHPHLNSTKVCHIDIPIPPMKEQESIAAHLDSLFAVIKPVISEKRDTVTKLKELRRSLISEAVTGKIEVPEVH